MSPETEAIQDPFDQLCVECLRCEHRWIKRTASRPKMCPKCHSRKYDAVKEEKPSA